MTLLRRDAPAAKAAPIDLPGILLLIIGVGSLQTVLDLGHDRGWFDSPLILTLAIVAGLAIVSLLIWEAGERHPVIDLSLFRDRTFSFCVLIISLGMMSFSVVGVIFPLWLQAVMGYTAYQAGLATAPLGVLALVFSILVGIYAARFDARVLATFGFLVFAARVVVGCAFHADHDLHADHHAGSDPGHRLAVLLHSVDRGDALARIRRQARRGLQPVEFFAHAIGGVRHGDERHAMG